MVIAFDARRVSAKSLFAVVNSSCAPRVEVNDVAAEGVVGATVDDGTDDPFCAGATGSVLCVHDVQGSVDDNADVSIFAKAVCGADNMTGVGEVVDNVDDNAGSFSVVVVDLGDVVTTPSFEDNVTSVEVADGSDAVRVGWVLLESDADIFIADDVISSVLCLLTARNVSSGDVTGDGGAVENGGAFDNCDVDRSLRNVILEARNTTSMLKCSVPCRTFACSVVELWMEPERVDARECEPIGNVDRSFPVV